MPSRIPTVDEGIIQRVWGELDTYHVGGTSAVTKKILAMRLGIRTRQVEHAIQALRRRRKPIASTCSGRVMGYFIAANPMELDGTLRQLWHRIGQQRETAQALERAFDHEESRQAVLFGET